MTGVEHLGQYVFEMTQAKIKALNSGAPPEPIEDAQDGIIEEDEDDGIEEDDVVAGLDEGDAEFGDDQPMDEEGADGDIGEKGDV